MVEEHDLILEVGCGNRKDFADSICLDIRLTDKVDVLADARYLPFIEGCFSLVYSSHTIEHFSHSEQARVLAEWIRVLQEGGRLEIKCPDLRARALIFAIRPSQRNVSMIYGEQDYEENFHKCGYSFGLLRENLNRLGIRSVRRVYRGHGLIPFIPDCLHIKGTKGPLVARKKTATPGKRGGLT
jgi:SAM-dependent methyltransferase